MVSKFASLLVVLAASVSGHSLASDIGPRQIQNKWLASSCNAEANGERRGLLGKIFARQCTKPTPTTKTIFLQTDTELGTGYSFVNAMICLLAIVLGILYILSSGRSKSRDAKDKYAEGYADFLAFIDVPTCDPMSDISDADSGCDGEEDEASEVVLSPKEMKKNKKRVRFQEECNDEDERYQEFLAFLQTPAA